MEGGGSRFTYSCSFLVAAGILFEWSRWGEFGFRFKSNFYSSSS